MATTVIGTRDTTNTVTAKFKADVNEEMRWLEDDRSQLARLLSTLPKKQAIARQVEWYTKEIMPKFDTLAVAITTAPAAGTSETITVTNGGYWRPQEILQVPTSGENLLITNVAGNVLTVTRGWGGTPATVLINVQVLNLGSAYPDSSVLELPRTTVPVRYTNYLQIFRDNVELSGTDIAIGEVGGEYAGTDIDELREEMLLEHLRDINLSMWFGKAASSGTRYSMGGIDSYIPSGQRLAVGGAMTRAAFEDFLRIYGFRYGAAMKVFACSYKVANVINAYATAVIRSTSGDTSHGIHLEEYVSIQGTLTVLPDRSIEGTIYDGYGYLLDMKQLRMRPLRDTKLYVDVQQADKDAKGDTYLTQTSIDVGNPYDHAVATGITG